MPPAFSQTLSTGLGASLSDRDLRSRGMTPLTGGMDGVRNASSRGRPQIRSGTGERVDGTPLAGNGMVVAKGLRLGKKPLTAPLNREKSIERIRSLRDKYGFQHRGGETGDEE